MSISRLSAGSGYRYLTRSTARGDCHEPAESSATGYYTEGGNPPGRWYGAGLAAVGGAGADGLVPGDTVTEEQMARLFGRGRDPVTDEALGRPYKVFASLGERVERRAASLPPSMTGSVRAAAIESIRRSEADRPAPHAVAGFDLTFSARKSVSVLWALGDDSTREAVASAHRKALAEVLAYAERAALFTRVGKDGAAQAPIRGAIAAAFDHWDSRAGDPQLHTHVVIANKVQGEDGVWRSLDSRALHHAAVTLSELYDNVLADHVASGLNAVWGFRHRGERRSPGFEIDGLDDDLLAVFSTRTTAIDAEYRALAEEFAAERGRPPSRHEVTQLRQRATLATRPAKEGRVLEDQLQEWAERALAATGRDPRGIAGDAVAADRVAPLAHDQVPASTVARLAAIVLDAAAERRTTFNTWQIRAEVHRATRGLRMATAGDRIALADRVTESVQALAVRITPDDPVPAAPGLTRPDGSSVFTRAGTEVFAHPAVVEAEARLLDTHLHDGAAATVMPETAQRVATTPQPPRVRGGAPVVLADDQAAAVAAIATSGRRIDVLVGAAGTGKTAALAALATAWETRFGRGSVIGMAPSATAAAALAASLGVGCENTAKWLHESAGPGAAIRDAAQAALRDRGARALDAGDTARARECYSRARAVDAESRRWAMGRGQLVIVDEASLAGTLALDQLREQAVAAGAKLLLVGDHAQLPSVDAGGAFGLLAERGHATELQSLWRFAHRWEADATRRLRDGDPGAIDAYDGHGRIRSGDRETVLDDAYAAWAADTGAGLGSLLIAADADCVTALNDRAHHDLAAAGAITGTVIALGGPAYGGERGRTGAGGLVLTRRNDRGLRLPDGSHVRNGDLWRVGAVHADGALTVARTGRGADGPDAGPAIVLPARYVAEHVDPGYATTAHRAQGLTADTAHIVVQAGMTREALYVAMTRGRASNTAYVATDQTCEHCDIPSASIPAATSREVLEAVLASRAASLSATQAAAAAREETGSLRRLVPIRDTLLAAVDRARFDELAPRTGLPDDVTDAMRASAALGPLLAGLRRAEPDDEHAAQLLRSLATERPTPPAADPAALLHHRLDRRRDHLDPSAGAAVAGPDDAAVRPHPAEARPDPATTLGRAVAHLDELISARLQELGPQSASDRPSWLPPTGRDQSGAPEDADTATAWLDLERPLPASPARAERKTRTRWQRPDEAAAEYERLRTADASPAHTRSPHR